VGDESLSRRAWQRTEFKGLKRAVGSLGVGILTLWFSYEAKVRPLGVTVLFMLCTVTAYLTMTALEFVWNFVLLGARDGWERFTAGLRTDVMGAVEAGLKRASVERELVKQRVTADVSLKLLDFLHDRPKGKVRLAAQIGNPRAYREMQKLVAVFQEAGWDTLTEILDRSVSGVYIINQERNPSEFATLIAEALMASGIHFRQLQSPSVHFNICTIFLST